MILKNQTILITGGSSGIGLTLAKVLLGGDNNVIICGRSEERLKAAKLQLPNVHTIQCDISDKQGRHHLMTTIREKYPACNVLVNNAAIVHKTSFASDDEMILKAEAEINTNLLAPIALAKTFLSHCKTHKQSAVLNITTGLVFAPRVIYPIYNATKAGLHAFTQVLRAQTTNDSTDVIEVMMPMVDTPWHKGEVPRVAISPEKAVDEMIKKIERGQKEIKVGAVKLLYCIWRISPGLAFKVINNISSK